MVKHIKNKATYYLLEHPFLLSILKDTQHNVFKQCYCACSYATFFTFSLFPIIWYLYVESHIISRTTFIVLDACMFLSWFILSCTIIKKHGLLKNVSFKKFNPNATVNFAVHKSKIDMNKTTKADKYEKTSK